MQTANDICKNVCMSAHTANQAQKAPAPVITFPSYNGAAARAASTVSRTSCFQQ